MTQTTQQQRERAIAIAKRDQLSPVPCARRDTGESIWLVQSRSQPGTYYLLTKTDGRIHRQCPAAQHGQVCAHAAAVHLLLQRGQPTASPQRSRAPLRPGEARSAEERQWKEEVLRRERALPWTDEKPFSIWKS